MSGDSGPYRGLCASTYDALVPPDAVGDVPFFRELIRDGGEPALEVGCAGTDDASFAFVARRPADR